MSFDAIAVALAALLLSTIGFVFYSRYTACTKDRYVEQLLEKSALRAKADRESMEARFKTLIDAQSQETREELRKAEERALQLVEAQKHLDRVTSDYEALRRAAATGQLLGRSNPLSYTTPPPLPLLLATGPTAYLEEIELKNIRCFEHLKVSLQQVAVERYSARFHWSILPIMRAS
jgi:hypothetical protein